MMVSRQFSRRYTLPEEANMTEVVSNLSQDGVMVITVPKGKKIEEVKENQKMKVEHKTSVGTNEKASSSESLIPMTMRDSFFDDPIFKDTRLDIESSQKNFFEKYQKHFEERMKSMESSIIGSNIFDRTHSSMLSNDCVESSETKNFQTDNSLMSRNWMLPRKWMMPNLFEDNFSSMLDMKDSNLISMKNDDSKMEISLNTAGYKPSELKVNVADGEISIEGKHEEKSEEGHLMVSRQFSRRYTLPEEAEKTEVVSNLSQDGVMVITVPKEKKIEEVKENQKMKVEHKTSVGTKKTATSTESL